MQVSKEQKLVRNVRVDVLGVTSLSNLSRVFVVKGLKLTVRSSRFTVTKSEGSSRPNHHPFLWKTLALLWDTVITWSPTLNTERNGPLLSPVQAPFPLLSCMDTLIPCLSFPTVTAGLMLSGMF